MSKEIIEVPVLSEGIRKVAVPLSLVTKANGFVFVSGTPPFDIETGKFVKGDIEVQTEACLRALQHCLRVRVPHWTRLSWCGSMPAMPDSTRSLIASTPASSPRARLPAP